jgi:tripartite-type tricarboxylate transporter receptor subunit TctC
LSSAPNSVSAQLGEQIAEATRTALTAEEYQRLLIETGFEPVMDSNPEEFRATLAEDVSFWSPVVKALDLRIE